ncbi:MAG: hypothetical protein JWO55_840, partial [Candidatus Saccharibacteria bacterium]|nr:hypothetical protein [Candidatus Saccharibacteria bacterium]
MASEVTIKQGPDKCKMMLGLFEHTPVIFTDNDGRETRLGIRAIFHHWMIVHGTLLDHAEEFRHVDVESVWLIHGHVVDEDGDNFLDEDEKDGLR